MLGVLRRNKNSPVISILLGLIALLMVGFGITLGGANQGGWAAKVNGEPISETEFNSRYSSEYRQKQAANRSYDRKAAERDNLREEVLNKMITSKLLAQEAMKMGLAVDDEALRKEILKTEYFQENGRFSRQRYERVLNSLRMSDAQYEESERERLLAQKMLAAVQAMGVSDKELKTDFERQELKINTAYIQVQKSLFAGEVGTITPADVEAWSKKVENVQQEVEAYYQKHKRNKYDVPKKVCARHILIKSNKSLPPDIRKKHQDQLSEAGKKIAAGTAFAEVAKQYSEDSTKNKGGDLGCFSTGQMVPAFEETAFGLKVGEVSTRVESPFGYHLIKVYDVKEPIRRKLDDVTDEIKKELAKETKAGTLTKELADKLLASAKTKANLQEALDSVKADNPKAANLRVDETGPFNQDAQFLPKLGMAKKVTQAAWLLSKEKAVVEAPVETDNAWIVLRFKEKIEPDPKRFDTAKMGLSYRQTVDKVSSIFENWGESLRKQGNVKINPDAVRYN